jgi:acyl-coenzyme A thioesterase PaaI-like protein
MSADTVFVAAAEETFSATELARGPWDPAAQHGGAPAALLMRAFERLPASDELALARVTYEFLRAVPLGELEVRASVARPGRRVQLLEASILSLAGAEVVRARALQVRRAEADHASEPVGPPPGPEEGVPSDFSPAYRPMFGSDAMEIRFVAGGFSRLGPSTGWFRLRVPLVAGEAPSPLQSLATAADFGNGISAVLPWDGHLFINPDLTVYVERPPVGQWICLQAQTRIAPDGVGIAESKLFDEQGQVGRATQALLVARR